MNALTMIAAFCIGFAIGVIVCALLLYMDDLEAENEAHRKKLAELYRDIYERIKEPPGPNT